MIVKDYADDILDLMCGVADALSMPSQLYLGLCSSQPNATNGAITGEPTASGYARKVVGGSSGEKMFSAASGGVISNKSEIQFKTVREEAGTMHYFFLSKSESGNAIMYGTLSGDITTTGITENTVPTFFAGELVISLDVAV